MGRNLSISLGGDVALKRAQGAPQRPYSGSLGFPGATTMGRQVGALLGHGGGAWAQTRTRRISRGLPSLRRTIGESAR